MVQTPMHIEGKCVLCIRKIGFGSSCGNHIISSAVGETFLLLGDIENVQKN
jgi:hypothetical protein